MKHDEHHTPSKETSAHRQLRRAKQAQTGPPIQSTPVLWYNLIRETETLWIETGWGLPNVWEEVHANRYEAAREMLDTALLRWNQHLVSGEGNLYADLQDHSAVPAPACICPPCIVADHTTTKENQS